MALMLGKQLVFLDSFQFMSSSLDWLANYLPHEAFKYTSRDFKDEKFKLMKQKGVYLYDYMDSFTKFDEKLPGKKKKKKKRFLQHSSGWTYITIWAHDYDMFLIVSY